MERGNGDAPLFPLPELTKLQGQFQCAVRSSVSNKSSDDELEITIKNNTDFDWTFNQGKFPMQIGAHIRTLEGALLRWDDGLRIPTDTPGIVIGKTTRSQALVVPGGASRQLRFPLSQINLKGIEVGRQSLIADFRLVQDGHAWFEHLGCKVNIRNYPETWNPAVTSIFRD